MSWLSDVGDEFVSLLETVGHFLGICGPAGFKVATDIMAQVAEGGTTPAQVAATAADLLAFTAAVQKAAEAAKAQTGTSTESVLKVTAGSA